MSSSVVRQLVTETRIAARPAQVVPLSQHVPSRWTASMTARVRRSPAVPSGSSPSASNRTRAWLSTTSLRIRTRGPADRSLGHPARERAIALDEVDQPGPPERAEGGQDREPARPAGRFGRPVVVVALAAGGLDVVRGAEGHRRVVGRGVAYEDEPRVVRHVEPLVGVGRPRSRRRRGRAIRWRSDGTAAAQIPNAPSTWTQAPRSWAIGTSSSNGSKAPVFTLPAWAQTMIGPSMPASASRKASGRIRP